MGDIITWICILIIAFPIRVAPKKVQKGTRKCPHVIPARSNKGFGIYWVGREEKTKSYIIQRTIFHKYSKEQFYHPYACGIAVSPAHTAQLGLDSVNRPHC